jgi:membrane protease YdiL (CAAX protease family)
MRLYLQVFYIPKWIIFLYVTALILMLLSREPLEGLSAFLSFIFLVVYLVKRSRFIKACRLYYAERGEGEFRTSLAMDASGVILFWFFGMMIAGIFIHMLGHAAQSFEYTLNESVGIAIISSLLMILLICRAMRRHSGHKLLQVLALGTNKQPVFRLFILPAAVGLFCAFVSSLIVVSRKHQPVTPFSELIESATSFQSILALFVVAMLLAPFLEEIIFRGFFYHVVERYRGRKIAILVIAATFAFLHFDQYWGDWVAIGMITFLGFALTSARALSGSTIPGIVMHYTYNIATTIIPVIMILLSNPSYFKYQTHYFELDSMVKEELLRESIHAQPQHAPSYNDLAWLYAEEDRDLDEALRLVEKALVVDPDAFAFLDTKAEVLYKMGRFNEAIVIAEDLERRYPSSEYAKEQLEKFRKALKESR